MSIAATNTPQTPLRNPPRQLLKRAFVKVGVLPILLVLAILVFRSMSDNFLTVQNLTNVVRQSVFLAIVSLGQMMVLLTGGFDLSVGTILALTSVTTALAMSGFALAMPDMILLAIVLGALVGLACGTLVGLVSGIGVAAFGVSPFIMTLGVASMGFGIALFLTGGTPVYGMPPEFGEVMGFGAVLGLPLPIWVAIGLVGVAYVLVNWTRLGRSFYAVGGNARAALLSGINTKASLVAVYVLSALFTAVAGVLLTARLDSGEANVGSAMPLESIAACVIAGVSLRGGIGRVENVVLGALFINLVQNGMNLARIDSYLQTVVIGAILIAAVIFDQIRLRFAADLKD
ncbi:ABC transporter permease [Xanthobacter autotrophicus]|uniref:ABC transporter permease n=1 Tax=Xanthobacter autotrophicus TaxID=280 RepID=UPI003726A7A7